MPLSPTNRSSRQSVPVHIITGFLGSGKSTFIQSLIQKKPQQERWAILINEFGQVGIDQALFGSREDIVVKGLPGGCLCCQLAFVLQAGLVNLLHRSKPDRVLIEPSGLGHPAGLLDLLRSDAFREALTIKDVIALLDPRRMDDQRALQHDTFRDQLALADGVVITMGDIASPRQQRAAYDYVKRLWPAKRWVHDAQHMSVEHLLQSRTRQHRHEERRPATHQIADGPRKSVMLDTFEYREPLPGRPVRDEAASLGYASVGWRWHPEDIFDLDRLTAMLVTIPSSVRVKGVWHTTKGWMSINRSDGCLSLNGAAWRSDSRLEMIGEHLPAIPTLEYRLQKCLLASPS